MFDGYATRRASIVLAFAAIYLIWGSTFLAIRVAVQTVPPLLMMSLRCAGAGLLLFVWSRWSSPRPRPSIEWRHWSAALVAGAFLFLVSHGALAWAELRVPSGEAALLSATTPLWLTIIDWRWGSGRRPTWRGAAGLAVGFAGVAVLVAPELRAVSAGHLAASAAVVVGALAWAVGSVYGRHAPLPADVRLATAMPLLAGSVWLAGASVVAGEWRALAITRIAPASWAALAYLIICGSVVGFTAYVWLLRVVPASIVGTHSFVNPIVAVALGALVGAERIQLSTVAAALTIAGGVMLAGRGEGRTRPARHGALGHKGTETQRKPNDSLCLGVSVAHSSVSRSPWDDFRHGLLALLDRSAQTRGGEPHGDIHDTGRAHRDDRRSVRREGVAWADAARIAPRPDRAAGGLAAWPASAQHLGDRRSRRVLEVRSAPAAHGRDTADVCVDRQ
jgi:drug/metabolite transporter (DMT)-like permease